MYKFERYRKNLKHDNTYIYSYNTKIAYIDSLHNTVKILGYWSVTTSKHLQYAISQLGLNKPLNNGTSRLTH